VLRVLTIHPGWSGSELIHIKWARGPHAYEIGDPQRFSRDAAWWSGIRHSGWG